MLEQVGIDTEIEVLEFSAYTSRVWNAAAFEHLVVTGLGNSMRDNIFAMRALLCDGSYADRVGWCNERFDELMRAAETEVDPAKRAAMLHEATHILATERPWITLFQQQNLVGVSESVDWRPRADELLWMFEAKPKSEAGMTCGTPAAGAPGSRRDRRATRGGAERARSARSGGAANGR